MTTPRYSSSGAKSTLIVFLICLCLACNAFPIVPLVGNSQPTSHKVVDPPRMNNDSLMPLLLKLRLSRHDFIPAKPNNENGQQEVGLKRMVRSTSDDSNNDEYMWTTPASGEDDSYVSSTSADSSSENDRYIYATTAG